MDHCSFAGGANAIKDRLVGPAGEQVSVAVLDKRQQVLFGRIVKDPSLAALGRQNMDLAWTARGTSNILCI